MNLISWYVLCIHFVIILSIEFREALRYLLLTCFNWFNAKNNYLLTVNPLNKNVSVIPNYEKYMNSKFMKSTC